MILADTSVWVDHLRKGDAELTRRLLLNEIVCHPFIVAEIALGSLKARATVLGALDGLASLPMADPDEIRHLIEARRLYGRGIGCVDVSLLASCLLAPGARLWTRVRRLQAVTTEMSIGFTE